MFLSALAVLDSFGAGDAGFGFVDLFDVARALFFVLEP